MHRTQTTTLVFALAAALVTLVSAVLAWQGVRIAFEREFAARLAHVAGIAAGQLTAGDLDEVRRDGAASGGYFALQAELDPVRTLTGFADLGLVDTTGVLLYDVRLGEAALGARAPWDSLAHSALARARGGARAAAAFRRDGGERRAAFEPVRHDGRVVAVLAAEAAPKWGEALGGLGRLLVVVALVSIVAIGVLAAILMRSLARTLALERDLSRAENLAAMGRLTATLAHEIRNPLAIIRGSARRLGRLEPEAHELAESVVEEVDRLGRTVGRYLEFARTDGAGGAAGAAGDLEAAVAATLGLVEGEFRSRACRLERELPGVPVRVRLDAESLKQLALNLVLNALEAAPEGGCVRVAVEADGRDACFRVRDDGPGFPAEVLARLGEPFLTTKAQGTGLGLHLARRLAEGAGGRLAAANPAGGGAEVVVRLPRAEG